MFYFWTFVSFVVRLALSLRYRIEVRGLKTLANQFKDSRGILFLPNHPAHMDPLFITLLLWPRFRMRPLAVEYIYRQAWMKPLIKLVKAVSIPSFETSVNQIKVRKAERAMTEIVEGLKKGENFLLYPAGKLKGAGKEILGGSSAAHDLVSTYPQVHVVLIRTTGLWGSSFSRALTGRSPDLKQTLARSLWTIVKNFIFFMPRRSVLIEIEAEPKGLPRQADRVTFNRFLEQWYNSYEDASGKRVEEEPLKLVSRSIFYEDLPEVFVPKKRSNKPGNGSVSEENRKMVYAEIARLVEKPQLQILPEMNLAMDLGMDSLQIAELVTFLGLHYEVDELHPEELETVQNVLEIAEGSRAVSQRSAPVGIRVHWPQEKNRLPPTLPFGKTIPEAFLRSCDRMRNQVACGDDTTGVISYSKLKRAALVLSEEFRKIPQERVGVLLPASMAAYLVIFAIQLAGKTPVMLNWTLGPRYLDDMAKMTQVGPVISSWRFLERLSHVEFGSIIDSMLLLEDIRENLSLKSKLRGAFLSLWGTDALIHMLRLDQIDENANAVILFTSGTEASPKGVPLSHKNILSDLRSAMQCIDLKSDDTLYAILPPFHSFGFSVVGLFPLLGGIKVAFYPDPTDSFALAEGIERWHITLFCSAPSFLKGVLQAAKPKQLSSVRLFVSGAEKAPPELFERIAKLKSGAQLIEGYGITECSPILSLTRPNLPPKGVGQPISIIELMTIHPETLEPLPGHTIGEICVRGPNVFANYLDHPRSPFIEIDGKKWYRTGDIGHLDEENNLILSGRLKRFTKIGGEMISLGAIEEAIINELVRQHRITTDVPMLAICVDETVSGKPQLILFSTVDLEREGVNEILRKSGLSRLIKISVINRVREIPLLGTGKTDYRSLQAGGKK